MTGLLRADVAEEARVALANQGELLRRSIEQDAQLVIEQTRGFRGLFQASVRVTPAEFEVYSQIVGSKPSSAWIYAIPEAGRGEPLEWRIEHFASAIETGFCRSLRGRVHKRAVLNLH